MKRFFFLLSFLLFGLAVQGQNILPKHRLFKVDPMSGLFKELRVSVEHRLKRDFFWYLAPYGYHQQWISKKEERQGRPTSPQKYYGIGLRAGARRYFFPEGESPQGFFFQGMGGYRLMFVHVMDDALTITDKTRYHQLGLGATVGYQWLWGRKNNLVYGFMGGMEYYFLSFYQEGYEGGDFVENWYEFPFAGKPDALNGLRVYLGIEVGFAFRQKRLHW